MKSRLKLLLCFILIFALSASLFSLSAAASGTYRISADEVCHGMIVHEFRTDIADPGLFQAIGSFCTGLNYSFDGRYLLVDGTPSAAGNYWLQGTATLVDGSTADYSFTIVVGDDPFYIPVETPAAAPAPEITKDPTGESLMEGESAMFIARAENASKIEWFLADPNMKNYNAPGYVASLYPGFSFTGRNSEVFEIYNVPLELDGWYAVCVFSNESDSIESTPAKISVEEFKAESPKITSHPQGANKSKGESALLTVLADNSSGGTLKYQWYMSKTGANNLNPISGANSSSYTPPQTVGTVYYTVAVWTSYNDRDSAKVYSNPAAVTYTEEKVTSTPKPSATPAPVATPSATATPSPSQTISPVEKEKNSNGLLLGLIVALVLSAALAAVILLILRKNAKQDAAEARPAPITQIKLSDIRPDPKPAEEKMRQHTSVWQCSCGALNDSQFCTQCGKPRFQKRSCSNCGWTPDSPNQIPRFCPECGTPFDND